MKAFHYSTLHIIIAAAAHLLQPGYGDGKDPGICASIVDHNRKVHVSVCKTVHKHSNEDRSVVCSSVQDHGLTSINRMGCTLTSSPVRQATSIDCAFVDDSLSENCTVVCNSVHEPTGQSGSVVCTNAYSQHSRVNTVQCTHIPVVPSLTGKNTCTAVRKSNIEADFVVCSSLFQDTRKKHKEMCVQIFDQVNQTSSNFCNQVNHPLQGAVKLDCTAFRNQPKTRASVMCSTVFVENSRSTSCAVFYDGRHQSGILDCTKHDEALARTFPPDCTTTSTMLFCVDAFKNIRTVGSFACFSAFRNAPKSQVTVCEYIGDYDDLRPSGTLYCSDHQRHLKESGSIPCNSVLGFRPRQGQISCTVLVGTTRDKTSVVCSTMMYTKRHEHEENDDQQQAIHLNELNLYTQPKNELEPPLGKLPCDNHASSIQVHFEGSLIVCRHRTLDFSCICYDDIFGSLVDDASVLTCCRLLKL
ncbi:hypothetical protein Btru_043278 [Bulinus truncatus]|nr:hypothetical protein Btru_043278 [Bulinus truncatus]